MKNDSSKPDAGYIRGQMKNPDKFRLEIYETLPSTNDKAKESAQDGAPAFTAVIADHQSCGRGRLGRSFYSPSGSGIYMSLILRPDIPAASASLITAFTAVAVSRAIDSVCGIRCGIKWVNDIFLSGKKVCGILCECSVKPDGRAGYAIVGIGVNVGKASFPPELQNIATCLEAESSKTVSREAVIAAILDEMAVMRDISTDHSFLREYRERSVVLGKKIKIITDEIIEASAEEIDDSGALIVKMPDGSIKKVLAGDVSIKL